MRVISATNRDLETEMENGKFREDLYFRLNVFPITIPTLAERIDDIELLANYFALKCGYTKGDLDETVISILKQYHWPGNVRELKNIMERAVILSDSNPIKTEHITISVKPVSANTPEPGVSEGLDQMEKQAVVEALEKAGGNKTKAAEVLKITRRMLYTRLKKYDLE